MKYAIIGSGKIGTALARAFARQDIRVAVANSRGPESLALLKDDLSPNVVPQSVAYACGAEIIFLAVPFSAHKSIAEVFTSWNGKLVVDVTNAFHVVPGELGNRLSSEVIAAAFSGASVVKAFNHLPAEQLGTNRSTDGRKQVVFLSSNDGEASAAVAAIATELGFAPVQLGRLDEGGKPLHVIAGKPGSLLLQNLEKIG